MSRYTIGTVSMHSPLILEAGPFAHDGEAILRAGNAGFGAVTTETVTLCDGRSPLHHLVMAGNTLLNRSRWSDIPLEQWRERELPLAAKASCSTLLSIGHSLEEVRFLVDYFSRAPVAGFKIVSYRPEEMASMVALAKAHTEKAVWAKISPNWEDPVAVGEACIRAGADALLAIDSYGPVNFPLDAESVDPVGWITGESIHALALQIVRQLSQKSREMRPAGYTVDIIGTGGISDQASLQRMRSVGANGFGLCSAVIQKGLEVISNLDWEGTQRELQRVQYGPLNLAIDPLLCTRCMRCVDNCGYRGWQLLDGEIRHRDSCRGCGLCLQICPEAAVYG